MAETPKWVIFYYIKLLSDVPFFRLQTSPLRNVCSFLCHTQKTMSSGFIPGVPTFLSLAETVVPVLSQGPGNRSSLAELRVVGGPRG